MPAPGDKPLESSVTVLPGLGQWHCIGMGHEEWGPGTWTAAAASPQDASLVERLHPGPRKLACGRQVRPLHATTFHTKGKTQRGGFH